jgi:hypothetical protein
MQKPIQALKSVKALGNHFGKKNMEGGFYQYPKKNILRTAKFLPTWDFKTPQVGKNFAVLNIFFMGYL